MTHPSSARGGDPHPAGIGDAPGRRSDDALTPETILGRRDVALAPWATAALVALAYAISEVLRGDSGSGSLAVRVAGALAVAVVCAVAALTVDVKTLRPLRTSMAVYLLGAGGLIAALAAVAAATDGLRSVVFSGIALIALYLGLVLSAPWSAGLTATMLAAAGAVEVIRPGASLLEALSVFSLTAAGWIVGLLSRAGQRRVERIAKRLTRCDVLTATLNRRGLIEELEAQTLRARNAREPIALMIFDLDGFKAVNTQRGNAAGDELLAWIGGLLGALLPARASAGRLGSDEFAVSLVGVDRRAAAALGEEVRVAIGERHPVSVGIATSENALVNPIDLVRVADAAMRVAKQDPDIHLHSLVVGGFRNVVEGAGRPVEIPPVAITYDRLRAIGGRPRRPNPNAAAGWLIRGGFIIIGLSGIVVVGIEIADGTSGVYADLVRWLAAPWVLANLVGAWLQPARVPATGVRLRVIFAVSLFLTGIGVCGAALSTGAGIAAPMMIGLALKVAFDAAVGTRRQARLTLAITIAFYALCAALSHPEALWAAPLGLAQLVSAHLLGSLSRRALDATTAQWVDLSRADVLTGLGNRIGFDEDTTDALEVARVDNRRMAILAVDLIGFKQVNETQGPILGDALLQRVADVLRAVLSDSPALGRLGGDEFVAAVPVASLEEADQLSGLVERAISGVIQAAAGCAVFPDDGTDVETLVRTADLRCRAAKAARLAVDGT
ncbi:MAG: GGDEF domain-containing protein [Solirubrobacteraceae bacterium]|nr:GGDEF domain-containing protein [Patulibacter sp.]